MMIKVEVYGTKNSDAGKVVPMVTDLTLKDWAQTIENSSTKGSKGFKMNFKNLDVVEESLKFLSEARVREMINS